MATYVIIRHGSNSANQPMCGRMALGTIEASSRKQAQDIAWERWTFYVTQSCEAIPYSRACAADRHEADEADNAELQESLTRATKGGRL